MRRLLSALVVLALAGFAHADNYGDRAVGSTVVWTCTTSSGSGPVTLSGGTVAAYKDASNTQTTSGVSIALDQDWTGRHVVTVDTSADGTFYSAGSTFEVVITAGTVSGVSAVGISCGSFSLHATSALRPTVAGRTLDVSATGEGGVDWANVGSPTTTVNLSGTTVAAVSGAVGSVTGNVGGSVASVSGNVGGNVTGSVGSVASGGISSSSFAAGAIDAAAIASNAIGASEVADGAIDAGAIATDAVDADALAGSAVTEIAAGITSPSAGTIADAVWDEALSGHASAGSAGAALSAAGGSGDPWASECGSFGDGTVGQFLCSLDQTAIEPISPVLDGGVLELVAGDAYDLDHGRALDDFALTGQPTLALATVTLVINGVLEVTASSVQNVGEATQTPVFELTAAQTALLTRKGEKAYRYQIQAVWPADNPDQPAVLAAGFVKVLERLVGP